MAAEHPNPLPKIRTFARDQARVQHRTEPTVVVPEEIQADVIKIVEKKLPAVPGVNIVVSTTKKPSDTASTIHIPAFHELKNKKPLGVKKLAPVSTPTNHVSSGEKKITVRAKTFDQVTPISDGRILTDSKKSEVKTTPSMFTSLKLWLKELVGASQETPKYSVTYSDRRKGVIQKTTSNSTPTSTAFKEMAKTRSLPAKEKSEPALTWTPNTETGIPLLEKTTLAHAPDIPTLNPIQQEEQFSIPVSTETVAAVVSSGMPRVFIPQPELTNFGKNLDTPVLPRIRITQSLQHTSPVTPLVIPEGKPFIVSDTEQSKTNVLTSKTSQIPNTPNPKTSRLKNGLRTITTFNTNLVAIAFAGSVVSLVLAVLIARTFLGLISPTTKSTDGNSSIPALTESGTAKDLALSAVTTDAFYAALASQPVPTNGVKEFRIVTADGVPLPTQEVLALLNFNANQNFNQSVTSVHVAHVLSKRAIILEVTDTTTVFGALLNWEDTMAEDLSSMLATGGLSTVAFTDKAVGQTDVRILSSNDTPVLVYGFINKNVVVITQDLSTFSTLLENQP